MQPQVHFKVSNSLGLQGASPPRPPSGRCPWTPPGALKGTNVRQKTYEIFHVYSFFYSGFMCQTTVIFGITKDGSLVLNTVASWNCFTCRNLFQNGANDMSECLTFETAFCKKSSKILYSSDHPILIKFRQLVVNIVIKELQMVFLTSTVINSNGNMKELERKIKCEKLMFR